MEKTIGYARSSTGYQSLETQLQTLRDAGCTQIFSDEATPDDDGDSPGLLQARQAVERGDIFMAFKVDHVSRDSIKLLHFVYDLMSDGIAFRSATDSEGAWAIEDFINFASQCQA